MELIQGLWDSSKPKKCSSASSIESQDMAATPKTPDEGPSYYALNSEGLEQIDLSSPSLEDAIKSEQRSSCDEPDSSPLGAGTVTSHCGNDMHNHGQQSNQMNSIQHSSPSLSKSRRKRMQRRNAQLNARVRLREQEAANKQNKAENQVLQDTIQDLRIENEGLRTRKNELLVEIQPLQIQCKGLLDRNQDLERRYHKLYVEHNATQKSYSVLNSWFKIINKDYLNPFASTKKIHYDPRSPNSMRQVLHPLLEDALDAEPLRLQVQNLKQDVDSLQQQLFSNVESTKSLSDEQFRQDFGSLASAIKSFSRSIKLLNAPDPKAMDSMRGRLLLRTVESTYWATRSRQKIMIEAFIWSVLYENVFDTPLSVLGDSYAELPNAFINLFGSSHDHAWPRPSSLSEQWRHATMECTAGGMDMESVTQIPKTYHEPELRNSMQELWDHIGCCIEEPLASLSPSTKFSDIDIIVKKAMNLSLRMSLQRSRLQVVFPEIGVPYDHKVSLNMESIRESEDVEVGIVRFIVNPGLAKWGDAHGKNFDQRLDLVPSLVFVEQLNWNKH